MIDLEYKLSNFIFLFQNRSAVLGRQLGRAGAPAKKKLPVRDGEFDQKTKPVRDREFD